MILKGDVTLRNEELLEKNKLLQDLILLMKIDTDKLTVAETFNEIESVKGSLITLETLIEFIEEGKYDKK